MAGGSGLGAGVEGWEVDWVTAVPERAEVRRAARGSEGGSRSGGWRGVSEMLKKVGWGGGVGSGARVEAGLGDGGVWLVLDGAGGGDLGRWPFGDCAAVGGAVVDAVVVVAVFGRGREAEAVMAEGERGRLRWWGAAMGGAGGVVVDGGACWGVGVVG